MKQAIVCPYCGFSAEISNFKLRRAPWKFRFYTVSYLQCLKCGCSFNYYTGTSPRRKRCEFTSRVKPKPMPKKVGKTISKAVPLITLEKWLKIAR
ncbi:MAG: hypothetical protein QW398_06575 [Desulfurococcaceae archaeon]